MKKASYFAAAGAFAAALVCASCGNIFLRDPRLYNTNSGGQQNLPVLEAPAVSEEQQKLFEQYGKDCNGFSAEVFDSWLLKVSFDDNNVPEYGFFEPAEGDTRGWLVGTDRDSLAKEEYWFNAGKDGNTAQRGFPISPMIVYQYRGKNPLVRSDSGYNSDSAHSDILERFRFYRFSGTALIVDLDNYLAAVDTHSKFLFVYAEITDSAAAVGQLIPRAYQTVEVSERAQKRADGTPRPFYEYDPIGYVASDGTVRLYDEYYTAMTGEGGAVDFFPYIIKDGARDVASHKEGGAGRSPYLVFRKQRLRAGRAVSAERVYWRFLFLWYSLYLPGQAGLLSLRADLRSGFGAGNLLHCSRHTV